MCGKAGSNSPNSRSARPYIGDESIKPPPAAKKRRSNSRRDAMASGSSPTSKVSQVPNPMTGMVSP